jgi:hypothetical protein
MPRQVARSDLQPSFAARKSSAHPPIHVFLSAPTLDSLHAALHDSFAGTAPPLMHPRLSALQPPTQLAASARAANDASKMPAANPATTAPTPRLPVPLLVFVVIRFPPALFGKRVTTARIGWNATRFEQNSSAADRRQVDQRGPDSLKPGFFCEQKREARSGVSRPPGSAVSQARVRKLHVRHDLARKALGKTRRGARREHVV